MSGRSADRAAALRRADRELFTWLAQQHGPVLDKVMPRLSQAADHGVLWLSVAAVLAASGRPTWGRAAVRGIVSVGVASATANGIAKLYFRRRRPPIDGIPVARRVRRTPVTTSFPSGHAASATAFALGAAREVPWLIGPLGVLAACVGLSRVWTGAHYPSDVITGALLGGVIAVAMPSFRVDQQMRA